MAVSKSLIIVFLIFYIAIIVYLLLYLFIPQVQDFIIASRKSIENGLTEGKNYFWAIFISFIISLLGSASIGFPVPFPFVLFFLSNSIYETQGNDGLLLIFGLGIAAGLGAALGEFTSFFVGKGVKKIVNENSPTIRNVQGFGKLVLDHPKSMYLYIFITAALPIPDDPLWIALGMSKQKIKFFKCLIFGWAGKNLTTLFYVFLPILIVVGFSASGLDVNDISSVTTEALMLIATLTIMFFILSFDWYKLLEKRKQRNANL